MAHPSPIEAYLEALPPDGRPAVQRLREQVARLVPDAVEAISYGIPTFKLNGRALVWFAAWKAHCSINPPSGEFLESNADELKGYRRTRRSLHFTPDAPPPEPLGERLVRARLADLERGGYWAGGSPRPADSGRGAGFAEVSPVAQGNRESRPGIGPERLLWLRVQRRRGRPAVHAEQPARGPRR